jgi:hypothetical protein
MSYENTANTNAVPSGETRIAYRVARHPRSRFESLIERLSGWISPILIKEARQAIKSRQLVATLSLLFLAVTIWSIYCAMSSMLFDSSDAELSAVTIVGFAISLAFPLIIAVPFWSFSSMSNEIEDTTYDLVLCTSMKPWQIVAGKLSAAGAQIVIYLSVVAPCFAFCAVLPATDLPALFFCLAVYTAVSLGLSALGLLMGTPKGHAWRILSMILFFGILLICFFTALSLTGSYFSDHSGSDYQSWTETTWSLYATLIFGFVLGPIGLGCLFAAIAIGAVSPKSSNRSTPVRIAVCFCWFVIATVLITPMLMWFADEVVIYGLIYPAIFMLLVGGWLVGENPVMSRRVRRSLPKHRWQEMLTAWFYPGPGRGYVFTMILLAGFLLIPLCLSFLDWAGIVNAQAEIDSGFSSVLKAKFGTDFNSWVKYATGAAILFAYVGAHLGVVRYAIYLFKNMGVQVNCVASLLLTIGTVAVTYLVWGILHSFFGWHLLRFENHPSVIDLLNGLWLYVWWFEDSDAHPEAMASWLLFMFFPGIITIVTLVISAFELKVETMATPQAVIEDELANQPALAAEISFDDIE